jgi:hypothetical protein
MRQAALLVEFDDRSLGVRPQLGSGGAEGIGGLRGMAALNPAAALAAPADVDVELAVNGLARDLDLELLGAWVWSSGPPQSGQRSGKGAA